MLSHWIARLRIIILSLYVVGKYSWLLFGPLIEETDVLVRDGYYKFVIRFSGKNLVTRFVYWNTRYIHYFSTVEISNVIVQIFERTGLEPDVRIGKKAAGGETRKGRVA